MLVIKTQWWWHHTAPSTISSLLYSWDVGRLTQRDKWTPSFLSLRRMWFCHLSICLWHIWCFAGYSLSYLRFRLTSACLVACILLGFTWDSLLWQRYSRQIRLEIQLLDLHYHSSSLRDFKAQLTVYVMLLTDCATHASWSTAFKAASNRGSWFRQRKRLKTGRRPSRCSRTRFLTMIKTKSLKANSLNLPMLRIEKDPPQVH